MDYSKVGMFIRQKRMDKGLTQQKVADILYVDVTTVSKWERGVTFPDSGLITRLCSLLDINEHELFVACEDVDYRSTKEQLHNIKKGRTVAYYIITGMYLLAILICFICNLAVDHTLSWFFIVLTSCLCGWTFIPTCMRYIKRNRLEIFVLTTFLSLAILFITCSVYTNNYWCFIAIVGVLLGYFAFFFPFIFYKREGFKKVRKAFLLIYSSIILVLTIILLLVVNSYTTINLSLAFKITIYSFTPVILSSLVILIPKLVKEIKGGIIVLIAGIFAVGLNGLLNSLLDPTKKDVYSINFLDWTNYSNGNVTLIIGIVCLVVSLSLIIIGMVKQIKKK